MTTRSSGPRDRRIERMASEILDVDGAAELFGVSKRTIYKVVAEKAIPAAKEWRFSRKRLIE